MTAQTEQVADGSLYSCSVSLSRDVSCGFRFHIEDDPALPCGHAVEHRAPWRTIRLTPPFGVIITLVILDPFVGIALPAFDFAKAAFAIADTLSGDQVRLRREAGVKEFLEEVLPIARFATNWEAPGRHVTVEYMGPNHPHDAAITLNGAAIDAGFFAPAYDLEVTSAAFEREHLIREALSRDGGAFYHPNIHRVGSRQRGDDHIVSAATVKDGDAPRKELEAWVLSAMAAKARHTYSRPSILLLRAEPSRPLGLDEWCSVVAAASPAARNSQYNIVVLVDWYNSAVHHL